MNRRTVIFLYITFLIYSITNAAEEFDFNTEISKLRKELSTISAQRKTIQNDIKNDKKDYDAYTMRVKKRFETIHFEIDSIEQEIKTQKLINDSLISVVMKIENSGKQTDLLQDNYKKRLISSCNTFLTYIQKLPPMIKKPISSSLSFLKSELVTKNVDNIEGTQRIAQIIRDMEESTGSIQVVQGASPVPEIRGTAYTLRIGAIFEAIVNIEGTAYAIWKGYDPDGKDIWLKGNDPAIGDQLLKCVNIRDGKALPAFIELPLLDSQKEGVTQ